MLWKICLELGNGKVIFYQFSLLNFIFACENLWAKLQAF